MTRNGAIPSARANGWVAHPLRNTGRRGFTLIEMVVVIVVILVIVGLVVPAAATLWNERKRAEAVNTLQGLLMTARARALQSGGVETGFFAFVDDNGVQHLVSIEQPAKQLADPAWQNVFVITQARDRVMPSPMRVVPRYVVEEEPADKPYEWFSDDELANNDFDNVVENQAQRHRNFFTIVYSTDGRLLVNRDVLIQDTDANDDGRGDRTDLAVGPGDPNATTDPDPLATTDEYYIRDAQQPDDKISIGMVIPFLVVDPNDETTAINFPSVDGLLAYDDSSFNAVAEPDQKRQLLLRTAQPLYVSRLTGVVIRGPVGEDETP